MVINYGVYHVKLKSVYFSRTLNMSMLDTLNMKTKARMAACEIFSHALTQSQGVALSYIFSESKDCGSMNLKKIALT